MDLYGRFKRLIEGRQVLRSMILRNLKDKYGGSALGMLWSLINPLLIALVITFVFTYVMKTEMKYYSLFVLSGLLPWFFFTNSITESAHCMRHNQDILNRFVIPKEIIPISVLLANFINFFLGFIIILPIFIIANPRIGFYLICVPLITLLLCIFTLGLCLCFSVLNVYFRDLSQILNVGTMFLFWLTPIFYDLGSIPLKYRWIIYSNPMFSYVGIYQSLVYKGELGPFLLWLGSLCFAVLSFVIGYTFFIKKEDEILKYI